MSYARALAETTPGNSPSNSVARSLARKRKRKCGRAVGCVRRRRRICCDAVASMANEMQIATRNLLWQLHRNQCYERAIASCARIAHQSAICRMFPLRTRSSKHPTTRSARSHFAYLVRERVACVIEPTHNCSKCDSRALARARSDRTTFTWSARRQRRQRYERTLLWASSWLHTRVLCSCFTRSLHRADLRATRACTYALAKTRPLG